MPVNSFKSRPYLSITNNIITTFNYRQRLQQLKDDHLDKFRGDTTRTLANSADPPSTVKLLLDYLFPDDHIDDDTQQQKYIRRQVNNWSNIHRNDDTPFHPVTDPPIICKQFVANFIDIAVAIYNQCLKLKHVPYLWKISVIRILPKPLKDDYTVPNSYRPIGLISVFARTLERIIERRLRGYLVTNKLISEQQYGFMAGKSTDHALYTIDKSLDESMRKNENTALISLDIRGAFDHAWHPSLIKRMILMKVPPYLIFLLCDYLDDRHILTTFGGVTAGKKTNRGTVQGSVLDVHVQAFADDVTMIVSCNSRAYFNVIVNDIMQMAYCWGQMSSSLSMNNMAVTPVEDIKILGVTFDRKLDYRPHVHKTLEKAARVFKKIMTIAQKTYGLGPKRPIYY
ncbi:hypothetical protein DERF_005037 [Dermatophagoides farinae]|uniref:Reverse transcriptase domain-containing protein n=1 Tax=Dermatophagoides farinae TaxID=6954 RepID=A0A922I8J7_DERFA|nr:hypothetical protein DERF_005037 [Dermatophagoides farinae]